MEPWLDRFARANFLRSADTAHDLKTPLNVAVLNLELLRMRIRKLANGDDDEKIAVYTHAIETELRRLGRIFDTFFILSTPPKGEETPAPVDVMALAREAADSAGWQLETAEAATIVAHESRIRQAVKLFFEGASKAFEAEERRATAGRDDGHFNLSLAGRPASAEFELSKVFKFYYTDPQGSPDLSLAAARLIAETYGGALHATEESDKVSLRLSLPLGER